MNNYVINNSISICLSLAKDWFMLHKKSIKFGNLYYFKQKIDLCEVKKFVYVLNYLKSFKAGHKNHP